MIDLHCHILPGIDDGASDYEEARKMLKIAEVDGIKKIVATPHFIEYEQEPSSESMLDKIDNLNIMAQRNGLDLEILPGNEVYVTPNIVKLIEDKKIATINNFNYLLIEFPMFDIPAYVPELITRLKIIGITPIIAHPERYREVIINPNILIEYIDLGALCQINSGSILGRFGKEIRDISNILIEHNMAHIVASDSHSSGVRAPKLKKAFEMVSREHGRDIAERLFKENPGSIIYGREVKVEAVKRVSNKKNYIFTLLNSIKHLWT